ncbi:sialate O-acetylesterase [Zobellia uliginosa]|uniref:Sialate O-acetylesterase n=1 Tax=Zobellia uliginosa TaxID=143224 RepID=A0ABY1KPS0_9FLAO|nr:sialate O-acetylesterase [Zobellia uliginosa]SIS49028.1 sialate O-acetylesterase [Zobellia uliginosa]
MNRNLILIYIFLSSTCLMQGQIKVAHIFGSHMVLQRNQNNPIWGTASVGEKITISFAGSSYQTVADKNGDWRVKLDALKAGGPYSLTVQGKNKITFEDILIGEVWICTGQSNMQWSVENSNDAEIEVLSADYPEIRLFSIPLVGSPEKQSEIKDSTWVACSPKTIPKFSAAGYFFGRKLHKALNVPIGLINASWGASSLETWIPREAIEENYEHPEFLKDWDWRVSVFTDQMLNDYTKEYKAWEAAGKPGQKMRPPRDIRTAQNRPGNGFNGVINPVIGYGIKGVIWCQGEGNLGRGHQYSKLFPILINSWRKRWKQGDFPFYWIQIASMKEKDTKPTTSSWAQLREGQSKTLSLPNTGEVVSMDLGERNNIHYRNKQTIGNRLARLALDQAYGYDIEGQTPRYRTMKIKDNKIVISFSHIDKGLYTFNSNTVKGFSIAGVDQKFVWAEATIIGKDKVEVYSDKIEKPVAVRYAWADMPVANLYDKNDLPVACFRTDTWPVSSEDNYLAPKRYNYDQFKK